MSNRHVYVPAPNLEYHHGEDSCAHHLRGRSNQRAPRSECWSRERPSRRDIPWRFDAVQLLRNPVLDGITGLGTGQLREHYEKLAAGGAKFYLSGASSKARGLSEAELAGKPLEFATPNVLIRLAVENDRVISY
jgi:hypothetical protein